MTYVNTGSVTAIGIVFPVLAIIALILRLYGWRKHPRPTQIDDILIIPSFCLNVAAGVAMILGAQFKVVGTHSLPSVTPAEYRQLGMFEYAYFAGHIVSIGFIKTTILFFFRRIFRGRAYRTPFDYANWTLISLVVAWTICFLLVDIFSCGTRPYENWEVQNSWESVCVDTLESWTALATLDWILDLGILLEPLFMIGKLNMSLKRKMQASAVFLLSLFAVIAGLLRMVLVIQGGMQGTAHPTTTLIGTTLQTADVKGIVSLNLFWTYIEIGVGFLVACLPPCAQLLDQFSLGFIVSRLRSFPSLLALTRRRSRESPQGEETRSEERTHKQWTPSAGQLSNDSLELSSAVE